MAQSLSKVLLHIIFSTKNRLNMISEDIEKDLHAYIAGTCRSLGCQAFRVGGTDNHIHIASSLTRTITISKLLEKVKSSSSQWIKKQNMRNIFGIEIMYRPYRAQNFV